MPTGYPDYQTPTNITAQDIAELQVDIVAQTLDKMGIDIKAQTLSNVNMDINAQTLTAVDTFGLQGYFGASNGEYTVSAGTSVTESAIDISAGEKGTLFYGILYVDTAATDSQTVLPLLVIDGDYFPKAPGYAPRGDYEYYNKIKTQNSLVLNLLNYNVDGKCSLLYKFPMGIDFGDKVEVYFDNPTGSDLDCGHFIAGGVL